MRTTLDDSYIPELEQEVLGAFLLAGDVKYLPGSLEPWHFIEPFHSDIFASIRQVATQYRSVRLELVRNVLAATGDREAISKKLGISVPEYLARLAAGTVRGVAGLKDTVPAMLHQWARFSVEFVADRLALDQPCKQQPEKADIARGARRARYLLSVHFISWRTASSTGTTPLRRARRRATACMSGTPVHSSMKNFLNSTTRAQPDCGKCAWTKRVCSPRP